MCQDTSGYVRIRQDTSGYVRVRQHTSAHVSIHEHTSALVSNIPDRRAPHIQIDATELARLIAASAAKH
jgi:hypothetical protein